VPGRGWAWFGCGLSVRGDDAFGHQGPCSLSPLPNPWGTILGRVPGMHQNISECLTLCRLGFCMCRCALWVSARVRSHCSDHMFEWLWVWGVLHVVVSLYVPRIVLRAYIFDLPCATMCLRVHFSMCWVLEGCHGVSPNVVCLHVSATIPRVYHVGTLLAPGPHRYAECGMWVSLSRMLCVRGTTGTCCANVAIESGGGCLCKRTLYRLQPQSLCLCVDSLGGHGRHGALPAVLSAGVCHTICVVSGCGCGLQSSSGVVSHSL